MSDVRRILSKPRAYEAWSWLVGGDRGRRTLVHDHVQPQPGERILDLGCGPGELLTYLTDVEYVGVDVSEEYIARARRSPRDGAEFRVGDATRLDPDLKGFDVVLAFGVLHHLSDSQAERLLRSAAAALMPGGRFVSVDPTVATEQSRIARLVVLNDRGEHVRSPEEYRRIAERSFRQCRQTVRSDLLRIPYTHCVLECS
jgi:SAM-dependent methyltransferase